MRNIFLFAAGVVALVCLEPARADVAILQVSDDVAYSGFSTAPGSRERAAIEGISRGVDHLAADFRTAGEAGLSLARAAPGINPGLSAAETLPCEVGTHDAFPSLPLDLAMPASYDSVLRDDPVKADPRFLAAIGIMSDSAADPGSIPALDAASETSTPAMLVATVALTLAVTLFRRRLR